MHRPRTTRVSVACGALLTVFSMIALAWSLNSCDSNPAGPKPKPEEESKDYRVWFKEGFFGTGQIFAYRPASNTVDSFYFPTRGPVIVSADGKTLYARPKDSAFVGAIDLDSLACGDTLVPDRWLPFGAILDISSDGTLMAVTNSDLRDFSIVNSSDYSVVYHEPTKIGGGVFTADNQRFYSGGGVLVDMSSMPPEVSRWECPFGYLLGRRCLLPQ